MTNLIFRRARAAREAEALSAERAKVSRPISLDAFLREGGFDVPLTKQGLRLVDIGALGEDYFARLSGGRTVEGRKSHDVLVNRTKIQVKTALTSTYYRRRLYAVWGNVRNVRSSYDALVLILIWDTSERTPTEDCRFFF